MPVTFSFDIEQASIQDANDRTRIQLAFLRFGWEHIGGSSWRYPELGTQEHPSEDWFNHVIPALMYFRAIVEHSGMNVSKMTLDAHSEAGYRDGGGGCTRRISVLPQKRLSRKQGCATLCVMRRDRYSDGQNQPL